MKAPGEGFMLLYQSLIPRANPLPLVSLYGERQAFAFRERERWESVAHESLFQRFSIKHALDQRAASRFTVDLAGMFAGSVRWNAFSHPHVRAAARLPLPWGEGWGEGV